MARVEWRDRARAEEGGANQPLLSFDAHAEVPGDLLRRRRMTNLDKEREASKVAFHKTIDGRYRDGKSAYNQVGVLILIWADDDLFVGRTEVPRLQRIFKERFGFTTEIFKIPSDRSATALHRKLADFAHKYDGSDNMAIVYYGGHGDILENETRLKLYAKAQGDWMGDPTAFFDDAVHTLKLPDTDILVIVDCCYAALAFSKEEIGRRKFELLSAVPPNKRAMGADQEGSFTRRMCDELERLLQENPHGFMTSKLYRSIYFKQEADRRPLLFDQSPFDYGKIWLKPMKSQAESAGTQDEPSTKRPAPVYIDLRLQMNTMPDEFMLSELARSMQYLPHVRKLTFEHLHAPVAELSEYIRGLERTLKMRPLIARLRRRLQEKRLRAKGIEPNVDDDCSSQSPLHLKRRDTSLYDWGGSKIIHPQDGEPDGRNDKTEPFPDFEPDHEHARDPPPHERALENAPIIDIAGLCEIAYRLDATGLKFQVSEWKRHGLRQWKTTARRDKFFLLGFIILFIVSFLITKSWVGQVLFE